MLVRWAARALYLGPAFGLSAHRNSVAVLAVGLHAPLQVAREALAPGRGFFSCRTALIEPNQLHLIQAAREDHAFIYVDASSGDLHTLRSRCRWKERGVSFDFEDEDVLIDLMAKMERSMEGWQAASVRIAAALTLNRVQPDARVDKAIRMLLAEPRMEMNAAEIAFSLGLSSSRFQHVFKEATGIAFRRFRLWARIRTAIRCTLGGLTLTEAAYEAGFSSSAHLSTTFKHMFGMSPTQLLALDPLFVDFG